MEDEEDNVLALNCAFYEALEQLDMDAMAGLWTQSDQDICIHPGWDILAGWRAVRESWRAIFANTDYMKFGVSDVRVLLYGDLARVCCIENIYTLAGTQLVRSRVAATNVFLRTTSGWRITLHHGSPMAGTSFVETGDTEEFH